MLLSSQPSEQLSSPKNSDKFADYVTLSFHRRNCEDIEEFRAFTALSEQCVQSAISEWLKSVLPLSKDIQLS